MAFTIIANVSESWLDRMHGWHMELFLVPTVLLTLDTLVLDLLLVACIFCSPVLRQETRYLLLANTLVADMTFASVNLAMVTCTVLRVAVQRVACEVAMAVTITAYCCAVLGVTFMVVDTYVAVRWPLHYDSLLPPSRARKLSAGLWLLASMYPLSLIIILEALEEDAPQRLALCLVLITVGALGKEMMVGLHMFFTIGAVLCFLLIIYCYVRLYVVTRRSGIWQQRYSRARVTVLAHGVLLLLYFVPGLVFTVELALFEHKYMAGQPNMWVNITNMSVLMLLPRALAPYLYGLRYREIYTTLKQLLFKRRQLNQVNTVS
ncbi:probable G-protein coupled receptor 148 [Clupea harengus]|uniref:Probable G-protein coupled receptor 148 n=1 Tax=Clupea harengus TaxID=7950 RepID=A0A6P3W6J0_CLUHA|nr:probable G-protein coupled receptor 148 [Clupea harengus]